MQELNARVDLDKKTPEAVAGEYLKESGLVNADPPTPAGPTGHAPGPALMSGRR